MTASDSYLDYTGPAPVQVGDYITVTDEDGNEHSARVHCTLATQFIADVPGQGHLFRHYADRGVTWQLVRKHNDPKLQELDGRQIF